MADIALADAHQVLRDGLRLILERENGFAVAGSYGTCGELVEALGARMPDVVILEIQLPDGDGAEWTARIKREHPETRVLVLTASHGDAELLLALEAGVDGYLYKEDPADRVVVAVRELLRGNMYISPMVARRMRDLALGDGAGGLSPREIEVLVALHEGLSTDQIARKLFISRDTVKTHIAAVYRKLEVHNRVGASREARRRGILPSAPPDYEPHPNG